jgi:hypothetical protein
VHRDLPPASAIGRSRYRENGNVAAQHGSKQSREHARRSAGRWSGRVTANSNALDLDRSVFTWKDPHRIALSLKRSAERSDRRKSDPYRSAMSMLTFYINRAGSNLGAGQRRVLDRAKKELRRVFGRDE